MSPWGFPAFIAANAVVNPDASRTSAGCTGRASGEAYWTRQQTAFTSGGTPCWSHMMFTVLLRKTGKRLLILEPPAAQAPPAPVRVKPAGQATDAHVLGTPPASVQLVEPELVTWVQLKVSASDGTHASVDPTRASAHALRRRPIGLVTSSIILKPPENWRDRLVMFMSAGGYGLGSLKSGNKLRLLVSRRLACHRRC
jgi:hypothetical protein